MDGGGWVSVDGLVVGVIVCAFICMWCVFICGVEYVGFFFCVCVCVCVCVCGKTKLTFSLLQRSVLLANTLT